MRDHTGGFRPLPDNVPDQLAPVVRTAPDGERELVMMRWGFPPPQGKRPVINVRHTRSPYWRPWLEPEYRCLVPATSFCEWTDSKVPHWFGLSERAPVFAFAGIWRPWRGVRKGEDGEHLLFAILTTAANAVVCPIHAESMPVVLTEHAEFETWLTAPVEKALALQRPMPSERLQVVATGEHETAAQGVLF